MKKFLVIFLFILFFLPFAVQADDSGVHFFYSPTCPVCKEAKPYLENLYKDKLIKHNVFDSEEVELLDDFYQKYNVPEIEQGLVPITFIGDKYILGFNQEEFKPTSKSPLILAITLGALDGFNPCAMLALAFLLTILITTKSRKKILLIAGTFILVSGLVYFLFISAWLNLFLFLSFVKYISVLVGLVIIFFALAMIWGPLCRLCKLDSRSGRWQGKIMAKLEKFSKLPLGLALLGVALVAAGVNTIELFCSFGFPLAFTKFLTSLNLPIIEYYFYILIYVIFYMLDDFLIFLLALWTLRITGLQEKYLKYIKYISAIILLILGIIMLINPSLLAWH